MTASPDSGTDYIGFTPHPDSGNYDTFIDPGSLDMNTYYIEYRTSGALSGAAVLFHYKVACPVPEPGWPAWPLGGVILLARMHAPGRGPRSFCAQARREPAFRPSPPPLASDVAALLKRQPQVFQPSRYWVFTHSLALALMVKAICAGSSFK